MRRANALGPAGWRPLFERFADKRRRDRAGSRPLIEAELRPLRGRAGRNGLAEGVIHADLFPDNVFFLGGELSGLIDFYFACNDALAYDLAICLNAWCFEQRPSPSTSPRAARCCAATRRCGRCRAAERAAMPLLARGAALRFLLTRAYDWLNTPTTRWSARKNPLEYVRRLRFHQGVRSIADYGLEDSAR